MSAGLIKHLKKKTEEDPNTAILMSQWNFDEQLVGKSLENVGSYYPHFSSHNESHSQQILVNIERLLGSNIDKLTATDTWLILEAAYWHDIGMLFSATEVQDIIDDEKFKDYVEDLANNNVQDLHEFAKVWHEQGWQQALSYYDNPYKGVEKYRQMVAEWYRRGHAENSNNVVLKPLEKLGINTPRTELLPQRIYRYLGQICWSHGRDFDYVMNHLPYRQTGMGTENCHPRFVACLLRLGDLFDIDDNRFCPVMAKQVGNMPSFSQTHKHKHQAIREFQLDSETVSVTAICESEMAYIECRNWFNWIQEEIQNQMSQWKNIVPSRDFGLLPTINKLDVEMTNHKILLDNKPMKFSLDEKNVIELLQGNNLYYGVNDIVRELIQNAIDATLLKVWTDSLTDPTKRQILENGNPYNKKVREIFQDYPITIGVELEDFTEDYENIWKISIQDRGIGISLEDLKFMQYIGGSDKNITKKKLISSMPRWMQPSGAFGIGMHSVFLLNKNNPDKYQYLKLLTKSLLSHESIEVKLHSPLSKDNGYCFIKYLKDKSLQYGTCTEFFLKKEVSFSINKLSTVDQANDILLHIRNSLTYNFITNFPEIIYKDLDPSLKIKNTDPSYLILIDNAKLMLDIAWLEYENYSVGTQIYLPDTICDNGYDFNQVYLFRGQEIAVTRDSMYLARPFSDSHLTLYMDIYGNTKEFLNMSRNDWRNYDTVMDVITNLEASLKSETLSKSTIEKIIHGFDYNKELGINIIRNKLNRTDEDFNYIGKMLFDNNNLVSDIIEEKSFMMGSKNCLDIVNNIFKEKSIFNDIIFFEEINEVYYNSTINYFLEKGFLVYSIRFSGQLDRFNFEKPLLFYKPDYFSDLKLDLAFYIDDLNIATFSPITKESLETEVNNSIYTNVGSYNFIDKIKELDNKVNIPDNTVIYINKNHDDYYLFQDFKDLEVYISDHYDDYYLEDNYRQQGLIFPFYFDKDQIKSHSLKSLCEFVRIKSINSSLSIKDVENQYKNLINLIKNLVSDSPTWNEFFQTYEVCFT